MLKATFREREQLIAHYEGELIPGPQGPAGPQGVGISTIEKTGTSGLVDTYTITLTNGDTTTFEVTNGEDGDVTTAAMNAAIEAALSAYSEGDYPDMQVGGLFSDEYIVDTAPYIFRPTAGGKKVGNRERDKLIGGTVAWNQLANVRSINIDAGSGSTTNALATFDLVNTHKLLIGFTQTSAVPTSTRNTPQLVNVQDSTRVLMSSAENYHTSAGRYWWMPNASSVSNGETQLQYWSHTPSASYSIDDVVLYDLTAYLNPTIADYVYSLEQATAGSGIAWLKKYDLIDDKYHAHQSGKLESVNASAHVVVGKNLLNPTILNLAPASGVLASNANYKSMGAPVIGGQTYTISRDVITGNRFRVYALSVEPAVGVAYTELASSAFDSSLSVTVEVPQGKSWLLLYLANNGADITSHIQMEFGLTATSYVPYTSITYPTSPVILRGILKTDENGNLYYYGDEYLPDGTVNRRFAEIDLGDYDWIISADGGEHERYTLSIPSMVKGSPLVVDRGFTAVASYTDVYNHVVDNSIIAHPNATQIEMWASAFVTSTSAQIRAAMSGVKLVYELATPTTESADPFAELQVVEPDGTEEYIDYGVAQGTRDVAVPVGHYTEYIPDLSANTINDRITALEDGTYTPDNPTATANVTSGKYFMVGSVLYKATASIAAGDKIVVGTNCTKPSIADALNSLS